MPFEVPRLGFAPLVERSLAELGAGTELAAGARDALVAYLDEVVVWNRKIDLTAARSPEELVDLFVADAAVIARATPHGSGAWVDVGSGAGAPGLVLAVLMPGRHVTLVEPRERRVAFLRSAVGKLRLPHVVGEGHAPAAGVASRGRAARQAGRLGPPGTRCPAVAAGSEDRPR